MNLYLLASIIFLFFPITYVQVVVDNTTFVYPPGINFTLIYYHSVEKQLVVEKYYADYDGIHLTSFYAHGCGSGLPCGEGDGNLWSGEKLVYIFVKDNYAYIILDDIRPVNRHFEIKICKMPVIFYIVKNIKSK